ncbi:SIS domain-containing protein [Streptomyces sp. DZ1-3]|uniref:SIS domain-containing protein n=1 Tax=Streptomyces sp. DZ1-3 TaxID=3417466 RepID=UPI003CF88898
MARLDPEVMIRQAGRLAGDLDEMTGPVGRTAAALVSAADWGSADSVHLVGDGDSYYAAVSAELAFRSLAGVDCAATPALGFLEYEAPWLGSRSGGGRRLVVGVSASGFTPRVVEALARAGRQGAATLAVTGVPDSPLARAADHTLPVRLAGGEPSPGIRTYQASLLALLLLAVRLGEARKHHTRDDRDAMEGEIAALRDGVARTVAGLGDACGRVAELVGDGPVVVMVGSGPALGTAQYGAAKLIEGAGVFARGQDLEEWNHVERFAGPYDMPLFVLAPPGRSHARAVEVAARATELGRRVIAVAHPRDTAVVRHAAAVLPVAAHSREEFSPLLHHLFAGILACRTGQRLGRAPFSTGLV